MNQPQILLSGAVGHGQVEESELVVSEPERSQKRTHGLGIRRREERKGGKGKVREEKKERASKREGEEGDGGIGKMGRRKRREFSTHSTPPLISLSSILSSFSPLPSRSLNSFYFLPSILFLISSSSCSSSFFFSFVAFRFVALLPRRAYTRTETPGKMLQG